MTDKNDYKPARLHELGLVTPTEGQAISDSTPVAKVDGVCAEVDREAARVDADWRSTRNLLRGRPEEGGAQDSEAPIAVAGTELSHAQSMTVRVALASFLIGLEGPIGAELGEPLRSNYETTTREILDLILQALCR